MRPTLLKSFIVSLVFWFICTTFWWSLQRPEVNLKALQDLKDLLPFLPFQVPETASILGSLSVQGLVMRFWLLPLLSLSLVSGLVGYGVVWLWARSRSEERTARETGHGDFRGITLTLGVLPEPLTWPCDEIDLGSEEDGLISRMTSVEKKLLEQILGTLSAHPEAYAGDGISISLLDHALTIADRALRSTKRPGLSAVVAAAHELGKITAYVAKPDGSFFLKKPQDKEAAKILGALSAWFELPDLERSAVMIAVKYHSTPRELPEPDSNPLIHKLARELLTAADDTAAQVVVQEKQKTLEKTLSRSSQDLSDIIFDAFMQALPSLSFQNRGLPKGVAAVAWKVSKRVFMLEIKLRETIMSKIPLEVRGALTPNPKDRARLQPFTMELLKALDSRGWLVKEINGARVDSKEALWNVKAGKLEFKGVIVIDVPAEYLSQLPSDDSMYEVAVTGPLFTSGGGGGGAGHGMTKQDLLGSVLKAPAPKPDAV